jgi:hypothetical protein
MPSGGKPMSMTNDAVSSTADEALVKGSMTTSPDNQ